MWALLGNLGWPELLLIAAVLLLLFGAKRLPDIARSLRQAIDEFRKGSQGPST